MPHAINRSPGLGFFVRVLQGALVGAFFGAYFSEDALKVHVLLGYVILALLSARIVWGFTGTPHAQFSDFVRGPATAQKGVGVIYFGAPVVAGLLFRVTGGRAPK
jgi:cytochrome b